MACSLGFTLGAKSTGIPLTALASVITLYVLRKNLRDILHFAVALIVAVFLWGSVETYISNVCLHNYPLGSKEIMMNTHNDGVRGAMANAIRYTFGSVNFGLDVKGERF
jgi:hypothetical protein